jgi:hypothetical protein
MLGVETIAKIRRAYFAQTMTIKAIWRALRLARKVGRKVIRSETAEFHCKREVQPQPKSSPWCDRLDPFLVENDGKPAGEQLTPILVYEALRALGYACGYAAVRRFARSWCKERVAHRRPSRVMRSGMDLIRRLQLPIGLLSGEAGEFAATGQPWRSFLEVF